MTNFDIIDFNLESDKKELSTWDELYTGKPEYASIEHFILEDHIIYDMEELIETNHELLPIDFYEMKKALAVKSKNNELIGFLLCYGYETDITSTLYLQYIVLSPKKQHKGYGPEILTEFFGNMRKYLGFEPVDVYALVHKENTDSQNLFKRFGFTFSNRSDFASYLRADSDSYSLKQTINQKAFE